MTKSALKKLKVFVLAAFLVLFVAGTVYAVIQPRPITAYATDYYLNDVRLANSASNGHWYTYYSNDSRAYVTGVYQNNNGWWYVENGEVNFNYTGFADNSNGRWRIENGKVNFNYKDIVYESSQWRYYYNGMFQKSYTGVTNCCNSYGWWYVKNGVVDFSYNGVADNNNGTWKIEGGKVNFGFNGTQIINGEQYNFVGGKVSFEEYEATTYTVGEIPYTQEVLSTSVNGQEIYVREYIPEQLSGETVIVSHGLDGNCEDMVFYAEALAKNGHIAFIFDYRGGTWDGTCKSDGNYDDMSVDTELLDLDAVYELATAQENVNTSNITLLGHSQGGFVSALYAGNNNNKIKNLVLVAPAYCIPDWGRANRLLPAWNEAAKKYDGIKDGCKFNKNVLIVHGGQDTVVPINYAWWAWEQFENNGASVEFDASSFADADHVFTGYTTQLCDTINSYLTKFQDWTVTTFPAAGKPTILMVG